MRMVDAMESFLHVMIAWQQLVYVLGFIAVLNKLIRGFP